MIVSSEKQAVRRPELSARHWLGKASAGLLLGFSLSLGLSGILIFLTPGGTELYGAKHQLGMWSIGLFWNAILATCFLFRNARGAWLWLGLANVVCYALLFGGRALLS